MAVPRLPPLPDGLRPPEALREATPSLGDYGDLEALLDEADRAGVLDVPAEEPEAATAGRANLVREPVIAERLWLLGYLADMDDSGSAEAAASRNRFLAAVAAFQRDAGLTVDQWVGDETWQALQGLVTFEAPTNVRAYLRVGEPLPALVRAARLRLWALGILEERPSPADSADTVPAEALSRFSRLAARIRLEAPTEPDEGLVSVLEQLFDQDALVRAVAATARPGGSRAGLLFSYFKAPSEKRRDTDPEVASFLVALAKVELWLLGFDVDIGPDRDFPVYNFRDDPRRPQSRKVAKALRAFWAQLGQRTERRLRTRITPELFQAFAEADAEPDFAAPATPPAGEYSREVLENPQTKTNCGLELLWSQAKGLGMKLWDGIRRLWRWICRGVTRVLEVGRNLVRAFFRYALKAFRIARDALHAATAAMAQYVSGVIRTDGPVRAAIAVDGDFVALVPAAATEDEVTAARANLQRFAAGFHLSCKLLSLLLHTLRTALVGMTGWPFLLWALVHAYRDFRPVYLELRAISEPG